MTRTGLVTYGLASAVLSGALILAAVNLSHAADQAMSVLDPAPGPLYTQVREAPIEYRSPARLSVTTGGSSDVTVRTGGTVTSVTVSTGVPVSSGDVMVSIDGQELLAYSSDVVLYRSVSPGDTGEDVALLQTLMNTVLPDRDIRVSRRFDAATSAQLRRFRVATGRPPGDTIDPQWFIRLPGSPVNISEVLLAPGDVIAPDTALARTTGHPSGIALTTASAGPDGEYVFSSQGVDLPVRRSSGEWSVTDEPALADFVTRASTTPTSSEAAPGTASGPTFEGSVRLAQPLDAVAVPAAALIGQEGNWCVAIESAGGAPELTPVEITDSTFAGEAVLATALPPTTRVLVNPKDLTCP